MWSDSIADMLGECDNGLLRGHRGEVRRCRRDFLSGMTMSGIGNPLNENQPLMSKGRSQELRRQRLSTPLHEAEHEASQQAPATQPQRGPRWFLALLISLPLIVLNAIWIANSEMRTGVTEVTISTLFSGVLFVLFALTLLNLLARRLFGPARCLTQIELLIVYMLLSLSSSISGVGSIGFFTAILVTPFYYATPQNGWKDLWPNLPWYIGPRDKAIYNGYFNGHDTFFRLQYIEGWAGPLLVWSLFFLVLLFTMLCLSVILRRRWA